MVLSCCTPIYCSSTPQINHLQRGLRAIERSELADVVAEHFQNQEELTVENLPPKPGPVPRADEEETEDVKTDAAPAA